MYNIGRYFYIKWIIRYIFNIYFVALVRLGRLRVINGNCKALSAGLRIRKVTS